MFPSNWADDRIEQLKSLWRAGLSASQVANALGNVTRNAVLGKLHRLGLLSRRTAASPAHPRSTTSRCRAPRLPKVALPVPVAELDPFTLADGSFATLATMSDRMCRWPIGDPKAEDFHFCGHAAEAGSCYCEAHTQRARQAAKDKPHRKIRQAAAKRAK